MTSVPKKDLIVLVADKNIEFAIKGLLTRSKSLKIRDVTASIHIHLQRDPGCLLQSHNFLRPFINQYDYALVIFDLEGCGQEGKIRDNIEAEIEKRLADVGWDNRAAAIAIKPELEIWVWSDSPHVDSVLGWESKEPSLKGWLQEKGFLNNQQNKPDNPKEALEAVLEKVHKPRSSALYFQLAEKVSINRCGDGAFIKLKNTLQKWFPK